MCRHLLQLLAGGPFPVVRYLAAARNDKRQVRRCLPLSLAFGVVRSTGAPPASWAMGALLADPLKATGDREP